MDMDVRGRIQLGGFSAPPAPPCADLVARTRAVLAFAPAVRVKYATFTKPAGFLSFTRRLLGMAPRAPKVMPKVPGPAAVPAAPSSLQARVPPVTPPTPSSLQARVPPA